MGKLKVMFIGFSIIALLLGGCGTKADENANEENKNDQTEQKDETGSNNQNGSTTENDKEEDSSGQNKDESKPDTVRLMEQNMQYKVNGEAKEETAFLTNSDNQNFSLYVLPEYELNAEEPGKDILTLKGREDVFMRIELLPKDTDWTAIEENTLAQLKAVSDSVQTVTEPGLTVGNGTVQEAASGDERVTAVLIKDDKTPVRLTIFTAKDADHRQAFIEMGKTIAQTK
jgi:hypothetical protein